jgi:hypothetical protein
MFSQRCAEFDAIWRTRTLEFVKERLEAMERMHTTQVEHDGDPFVVALEHTLGASLSCSVAPRSSIALRVLLFAVQVPS